MSAASWSPFAARYARLQPPLAPCAEDVARLGEAIEGHAGEVLLLGVTPALVGLGRKLVAVDHSAEVIRRLWPGDAARRAVQADWSALPFAAGGFDAVVGDGVITSFDAAPDRLFAELRRVLRPGGVAALRCFCAPDDPETTTTIAASPGADGSGGIDALKWRIAMQLAARDPEYRVAARDILTGFNALFPDRDALLARTGWRAEDLVSVDGYATTRHHLRFLPRRRLLAIGAQQFYSARIATSRGYPLADRCPILVLHV